MGQKTSKLEVSESWLKPHGQHRWTDVDLRKLKTLVRAGKLAPCYRPYEDDDWKEKDLEECPICFLAYPALNWSKCCSKEICTECFLQVKWPNGNRTNVPCPYCKSDFSVVFRGARSSADKLADRQEEQRVLTATLRARQQSGESASTSSGTGPSVTSVSHRVRKPAITVQDSNKARCALERAATDPVPFCTPNANGELLDSTQRRRRRSSTEEEVLRAICLSLELAQTRYRGTTAPASHEQEQEMIQQAIRASLSNVSSPQVEIPSPQRSVVPQAVALSPLPSRALSMPPPERMLMNGSTPSGCLPPLEIGADSPDRSVSTSGSSRLLRYNESLLTAVQQSSALSSVSSSCEAQRNQASADGSSMALMPVETHGKGPKTPRPPMKSLMSYDPSLGRHASLHKHQSGLSSSGYLQQACQIKANTEGHTPNLTSRTVNIGQADSEGHTPNLSSRTVNIGQQPGEETCTSKGQDPMTLGIGLEDSRLLGRYGWTLSAQDAVDADCRMLEFRQMQPNGQGSPKTFTLERTVSEGRLETSQDDAAPDKPLAESRGSPIPRLQLSSSIEMQGARATQAMDSISTRPMQLMQQLADCMDYSDSVFSSASGRSEEYESYQYTSPQSAYLDRPHFREEKQLTLDRQESSAQQDLIPASWNSSAYESHSQRSCSTTPRYCPPLGFSKTQALSSHDSPEDPAWLEFKQSILGPDWVPIATKTPVTSTIGEMDASLRQCPAVDSQIHSSYIMDQHAKSASTTWSADQQHSAASKQNGSPVDCDDNFFMPMHSALYKHSKENNSLMSQVHGRQDSLIGAHYHSTAEEETSAISQREIQSQARGSASKARRSSRRVGSKSISFADLVQDGQTPKQAKRVSSPSAQLQIQNTREGVDNMNSQPSYRQYAEIVDQRRKSAQPPALLMEHPDGTADLAVCLNEKQTDLLSSSQDSFPSYEAPNSAADEALKQRIKKADLSYQSKWGNSSTGTIGSDRPQSAQLPEDAFLARLRAADQQYAERLKQLNTGSCN